MLLQSKQCYCKVKWICLYCTFVVYLVIELFKLQLDSKKLSYYFRVFLLSLKINPKIKTKFQNRSNLSKDGIYLIN